MGRFPCHVLSSSFLSTNVFELCPTLDVSPTQILYNSRTVDWSRMCYKPSVEIETFVSGVVFVVVPGKSKKYVLRLLLNMYIYRVPQTYTYIFMHNPLEQWLLRSQVLKWIFVSMFENVCVTFIVNRISFVNSTHPSF